MDALELLENIEALDIETIAGDALRDHQDRYVELNKEQLLEGKLSTGMDITPSYLSDPYFKTPAAAQKYSDWKDKITPNPKRGKGVPNLFIIGSFHNSISMEIKKDSYEILSDYKDAGDIMSKFTENIFGLDEEKAEQLIEEGLADSFYDKAHEQLGI
jgi:hypothetical protein